MITFTWWEAIIIITAIYWPITALVSIAILATAFIGTKHLGWRLFWSMLAVGLLMPTVWLYLIA